MAISLLIVFVSDAWTAAYPQESSEKNKKTEKNNTTKVKKSTKKSQRTRFIPSEKINADSSVSFPVDI